MTKEAPNPRRVSHWVSHGTCSIGVADSGEYVAFGFVRVTSQRDIDYWRQCDARGHRQGHAKEPVLGNPRHVRVNLDGVSIADLRAAMAKFVEA